VDINGNIMALKQTSKTNNYKSHSDINAAKNEVELQEYLIEMFESICECDIHPNIIKEGYSYISKMVYKKNDSKDMWIGYELGKQTLNKLTFNIKGTF